jgi:hypothetical protein
MFKVIVSLNGYVATDEGAELTIIAAAGTDPSHGLPGVTNPRKAELKLTIDNHTFTALEDPRHEVWSSRWSTRGWTYQEALLSRRRLVITETQIYLQCLSEHFVDGLDDIDTTWEQPRSENLRIFPRGGIGSTAMEIYDRLPEYYLKDLSYDTDAINAFSGIFQAFAKLEAHHSNSTMSHFYGLPIIVNDAPRAAGSTHKQLRQIPQRTENTYFALGLAWKVSTSLAETQQVSQPVVQNSSFPSWSWASSKVCRENSVGRSRWLHFDFRFQISGELDSTIQIRFYHHSRAEINLIDYVQNRQDYTDYRPVIEITTYVVTGSIVEGPKGSPFGTRFSAFPGRSVWWQQQPVGDQATAVYVGTADRIGFNWLVYILVQDDGKGHYRRVGVLEQGVESEAMENWYRDPTRDYTMFLKDLFNGPEWHQQTLRLV